jgi:serine/threonine protein kinase
LLAGSWIIDPRFAAEHNITEEKEVLLQATMLFGDVPISLIKAGKNGKQFYTDSFGTIYRRVYISRALIPPSERLSGVDIKLTDFNLHKLIEMDPPRDLPASDVNAFVDFLSRMLKILPHERETPAQLLKHPWLQLTTCRSGLTRQTRMMHDNGCETGVHQN